jgi:DNA-binding LacI/PurR family transcriptional regulator
MNPGLTTVRLPVPQMALKLVERVIGRMADPDIKPGEFIFQPDLVERDSVAAPPQPVRRLA